MGCGEETEKWESNSEISSFPSVDEKIFPLLCDYGSFWKKMVYNQGHQFKNAMFFKIFTDFFLRKPHCNKKMISDVPDFKGIWTNPIKKSALGIS